ISGQPRRSGGPLFLHGTGESRGEVPPARQRGPVRPSDVQRELRPRRSRGARTRQARAHDPGDPVVGAGGHEQRVVDRSWSRGADGRAGRYLLAEEGRAARNGRARTAAGTRALQLGRHHQAARRSLSLASRWRPETVVRPPLTAATGRYLTPTLSTPTWSPRA